MKRLEVEMAAVRDLNINLQRSLAKDLLTSLDRHAIIFALGYLLKDEEIMNLGLGEISPELVNEIKSAVVIMNMLNVYYKTRFSLDNQEEYNKADLRMQTLATTKLSKGTFEAIAFAVSAVNGCPYCVNSHEKSLKAAGYTADQIHEVLRLSSIIKSLTSI